MPRIMPNESRRARSSDQQAALLSRAGARQMRSSASCSSPNTVVAPNSSRADADDRAGDALAGLLDAGEQVLHRLGARRRPSGPAAARTARRAPRPRRTPGRRPRPRSGAAARARTPCSTRAPRPCSARSRRSTTAIAVLTSAHHVPRGVGLAATTAFSVTARPRRPVTWAGCAASAPGRSCPDSTASACSPRRSSCRRWRRRTLPWRSSTACRPTSPRGTSTRLAAGSATVSRSSTLATAATLPQQRTIFSLVAWSGATPLTVTVCDAPSYSTSRPSACEALRGDVLLDRLGGGRVQRGDVRRRRSRGRRGLGTVEQFFAGFLDETDEAHGGSGNVGVRRS